MIKVFKTPKELMAWRKSLNKTVGFVPTMGALHEGHGELLNQARKNNEIVVLSIFVNPTQFNDVNDLNKYPKTWDSDLALAQAHSVDAIFYPNYEDLYPDQYKYKVTENDLSETLEGEHRPGHFDGVLSVVMKLLNIVSANKAYFGEKDYQQLSLIQGMASAFFMSTEIVPVSTVREQDGLAKSSRNRRLSPEERAIAPKIYEIITTLKTTDDCIHALKQQGFNVDYVKDVEGRRFVAAKLGEVRLIDNVKI